jgi:hypothetical protein
MKVAYLSAPYTTGPDSREKRQKCIDIATATLLRDTGVYIFSPITYEKPIKDRLGKNMDWDFWRPRDEEMVARCDEIWVLCLNHWKDSRGVEFEVEEAQKLGKFVRYIKVEEVMEPCDICHGSGETGPGWVSGPCSSPICYDGQQWTGELILTLDGEIFESWKSKSLST